MAHHTWLCSNIYSFLFKTRSHNVAMADLELARILPSQPPECHDERPVPTHLAVLCGFLQGKYFIGWAIYLTSSFFSLSQSINQSISISIYLTHITNQAQWSTLVIPILERWRQVDPWSLMASQPSLIGKSQSLMKDPVSKQKVASPLCGLCDFHLGRIRRCRRWWRWWNSITLILRHL